MTDIDQHSEWNDQQEALYQEFLSKTSHLRNKLQADVDAINVELQEQRAPFEREFAEKTSPIKQSFLPQTTLIDDAHRLACHKIAAKAHRQIDRLEKKRLKAMAPIQQLWEQETKEQSLLLDSQIEPFVKSANERIEVLTNEFNSVNKPLHDEYIQAAKELEQKILNTPIISTCE